MSTPRWLDAFTHCMPLILCKHRVSRRVHSGQRVNHTGDTAIYPSIYREPLCLLPCSGSRRSWSFCTQRGNRAKLSRMKVSSVRMHHKLLSRWYSTCFKTSGLTLEKGILKQKRKNIFFYLELLNLNKKIQQPRYTLMYNKETREICPRQVHFLAQVHLIKIL